MVCKVFLFLVIATCLNLQSKQIELSKKEKYYLSVCAVFTNETKYLKEWIEYHRLVGVDHFYLYSNNSTDRPANMLKPYIDKGIVTLIHWPDLLADQRETFKWSLGVQIAAYENAIYWTAVKATKWLAILDVDEFLVPINGNTLAEMLEKYSQYPGVVFSKAYYEANPVDVFPNKHLVIESIGMVKNSFRGYLPKSVEKMIFQPKLCSGFSWPPYRCMFKDKQKPIVLTQFEARVNQYSNRNKRKSEGEERKQILHVDQHIFQEQQLDALLDAGYKIEDSEKAVYRFVPEVLKRMGY